MENSIKLDDLGVPLFQETSILDYINDVTPYGMIVIIQYHVKPIHRVAYIVDHVSHIIQHTQFHIAWHIISRCIIISYHIRLYHMTSYSIVFYTITSCHFHHCISINLAHDHDICP